MGATYGDADIGFVTKTTEEGFLEAGLIREGFGISRRLQGGLGLENLGHKA